MSLTVSCPCGNRFEAEDVYRGQSVTCPGCHEPVKVPGLGSGRLRTSGYALASVVLALIGAFTVVLTAGAVVLGVVALVSIARHRDRVTGRGYAVLGIVLGVVFTGLALFSYSRGELFGVGEQVREGLMGAQVDRSGPLEILRPGDGDGFALTRPDARWGVARDDLAAERWPDASFVLAHLGHDAYLGAIVEDVDRWQTLEAYQEQYLRSMHDPNNQPGNKALRVRAQRVRERKQLPPLHGFERREVLLDQQIAGQTFTHLVWFLRRPNQPRVYVLDAWAAARRYPRVEPEFRKAFESFRPLP